MHIERLDARTLMDADPNVYVNLLVDADRNGVIDARDNRREDAYTKGRGALVLPNLDRDNTTTSAPDNWTGGVFHGRPVAPNHVIDNAADLLDVGRLRLNKLKADAPWEYSVIVRLRKPASDPAFFADTDATDRVRIFLPTKVTKSGDTLPQAGDVAVIGPGLGDEIRFTPNPQAANEYDINAIVGSGAFVFGVEGLTAGAAVRVEVELQYQPLGTDGPPPPAVVVGSDAVALRVAPFVLNDNRQRVEEVIVEDLNPYGVDNAPLRNALKDVFGDALTISKTGDYWQQDGYEIGYVRAPYGAMPVVLELPRSRDHYASTTDNMRSFVRNKLLRAGVGVSTDLSAMPTVDSSSYGGDIEHIVAPGSKGPGFVLLSGAPQYLKDYFTAQGVHEQIDLPLDWLAVNHVDEVVQQSGTGKVIVADPDLAWALLTWARKLDPNVRLHKGLNGNEYVPGAEEKGVLASMTLDDARLRRQSLDLAQRSTGLRGVVAKLKEALGLKEETTIPVRTAAGGTVALARGGAFTQLLGDVAREFSIRFDDATNYRLRYRDAGGGWSKWFAGRTDRDEVFDSARAFLLKEYWSGTAVAGASFKFKTRPDASLVKMPALFATFSLLADPVYEPDDPRLLPFSEDHINALVDGTTVVTGESRGPVVKWQSKRPASDLFAGYATAVFKDAGYDRVVFADAAIYHNSSGSIHCATNAIRALPDEAWWTA